MVARSFTALLALTLSLTITPLLSVAGNKSTKEGKAAKPPRQVGDDRWLTSPVDPKTLPKPTVLQNADGQYFVMFGTRHDKQIYFGTASQLYQLVIRGGGADGKKFSLAFIAPRVPDDRDGSLDFEDDKGWRYMCGLQSAPLTVVADPEAFVSKAKFNTSAWVRRERALARDDAGTYYYVDTLDKAHGGKDYRVFIGKKGAMKQQKLVEVADDTLGLVLSTKNGQLRLVVNNEETTPPSWVVGKKETKLRSLSLFLERRLIYSELGIYQFLGTPCDQL